MVMINDMMRAISRPANRSRTIACVTIRVAAPPKPWRIRPTISTVNDSVQAHIAVPTRKISMPIWMAPRRPMASDRGPKTSCPKINPANIPRITQEIRCGSVSSKSTAIGPIAGNIMSIASAIVAIKNAASAINSPGL